jgi:hypothetical protein
VIPDCSLSYTNYHLEREIDMTSEPVDRRASRSKDCAFDTPNSTHNSRSLSPNQRQKSDWLDYRIEAIRGIGNPYAGNMRPRRHDILLMCDKRLTIREYTKLSDEEGLNRFTKKFIRSGLQHGCIRVWGTSGERVTSIN